MKIKAHIAVIAVIFLLNCLFLSGCDNNSSDSEETEQTLPAFAYSVVTETAEPSEYPVYINETEIKAKPERVVSLSPSSHSMKM